MWPENPEAKGTFLRIKAYHMLDMQYIFFTNFDLLLRPPRKCVMRSNISGALTQLNWKEFPSIVSIVIPIVTSRILFTASTL